MWSLTLSALALLALVPPAAHATFRGANGKIAYSTGGSVYTVSPDGSGRTRLTARGEDPAFSPLGLRVSFERTASGQRDIWIVQANGSGGRRLTDSSASDRDPAWSPSGAEVAWTRALSGNWEIHTMNADGTGRKRITRSSYRDYAPAWSSKGKIAFVRNRGGNHDIYTVSPDATSLKRLTRRAAKDTSPSWSPDARKLAFVRNRDVYRLNPATGGLRRLTRSGGLDPRWSPDGRRIAFTRGPAGDREIYITRSDGSGRPRRLTRESRDARSPDWQSKGHDPVIAGAGDIACDPAGTYFNGGAGTATRCHARATANLLLNMDLNKVITLGDNQYDEGTLSQFRQSYDSSWGSLKSITAPSVGNHEYRTPGAAGYFDYFNGVGRAMGPAGNRDEGYYSYNVGANWHVVVLNSDCAFVPGGGCAPGSRQHTWLMNDLATSSRPCTLAYFHHALFESTESANVRAFWDLLHNAGAELVLNGHDHTYERFAPMTPSGELDRGRGVRQIIVGSGGKSHGAFDTTNIPHREVENNDAYGVLNLTLRSGSYKWKFVPEAGSTFTDSGTTSCH